MRSDPALPLRPYFLANRPALRAPGGPPAEELAVTDKHRGEVVARVALADAAAIEAAIAAACAAAAPLRRLDAYQRREVLDHCLRRLGERRDELARCLTVEAGKPIRDSRGEVARLLDTFRVAAEESLRLGGEVLDLASSPRSAGTRALTRRVPIGPCAFLTPFNFPLNLVAHKVAPALAAGCPFLLKPSERTPLSALLLGEILAETALPAGAFSVLPCRLDHVAPFIEDPRLRLLSFTGSAQVGLGLPARAGHKRVVLELGGNAACIVDGDQGPRLDHVIERLLFGAFYQSGQSCISVQRILVHESLYDTVAARLSAGARALRLGDPADEATSLGPLIDEAAAERLAGWIDRAVLAGARLLCGGERAPGTALLPATLLEGVPRDQPLYREEAFGPVALLQRFGDFDEALAAVNDSRYGLQAGVFTDSLAHALRAWDELEVGGVIIGDVPSFRVDSMPYGGVKDSGAGREGVRSAMLDMTEERLLVLRS